MKTNIGSTDIGIRLVLVVTITLLFYSKAITGTWAIVLGTIALVLILTSLFGICPLYSVLGINTFRKNENRSGISKDD